MREDKAVIDTNNRGNVERKGDCGQLTRDVIARNYLSLMERFYAGDRRLYLSMDRGDMFHTAIALILQDNKFQRYQTDAEVLAAINKRVNNVAREIIQDSRAPKGGGNTDANDIQTETEQAE